jgi:cell division initiation protein
MKLTPLDIRHKDFKRGMRGYNDVEVDEFLDEVADEYERLFKENIDLRDKVEALEEKVTGYQRIEETLQKTLINAQANAEEQKQNATKQGQLILQDAELKARQMVNEAYSERQAVEQSMAKLKSAEEDFRFKFKQMLEGYLRQFGDASSPQSDAGHDEFVRRAAAIKEAIAREAPAAPRAAAPQETSSPGPAETAPAEHEPAPSAEPAPPAPVTEAETTMSQERPAGPVEPDELAPDPRSSVSAPPAEPSPDERQTPAPDGTRGRILFGEGDDLLADVDTGVNENEFKW